MAVTAQKCTVFYTEMVEKVQCILYGDGGRIHSASYLRNHTRHVFLPSELYIISADIRSFNWRKTPGNLIS